MSCTTSSSSSLNSCCLGVHATFLQLWSWLGMYRLATVSMQMYMYTLHYWKQQLKRLWTCLKRSPQLQCGNLISQFCWLCLYSCKIWTLISIDFCGDGLCYIMLTEPLSAGEDDYLALLKWASYKFAAMMKWQYHIKHAERQALRIFVFQANTMTKLFWDISSICHRPTELSAFRSDTISL